MKKASFNFDGYLRESQERFNSMNASEFFPANGGRMFFADGGAAPAVAPSPYQITYDNSVASALTAVAFGLNKYLLTTNFGTTPGITVTPSQTNISYLMLLQQSASQPFETSLVRVESANTTQVTQVLNVTKVDASGQELTTPVITQSYKSAYQFQSTLIDVPVKLFIDGNTYVTFTVLASSSVTLTFFPAVKVNTAQALADMSPVKVYGNPQVNMGGQSLPARMVGQAS
jgi:hypothetical protein